MELLEQILNREMPNRDALLKWAQDKEIDVDPEIEESYCVSDIPIFHLAMLASIVPEYAKEDFFKKIVAIAGPVKDRFGMELDDAESADRLSGTTGQCGYQHYLAAKRLAVLASGRDDPEIEAVENMIAGKTYTPMRAFVTKATFRTLRGLGKIFEQYFDLRFILKKTPGFAKRICKGIDAKILSMKRDSMTVRYKHHPLYSKVDSIDEELHRAFLVLAPTYLKLEEADVQTLTSARTIRSIIHEEYSPLGLDFRREGGIVYLITPKGSIPVGEETPIDEKTGAGIFSRLASAQSSIPKLIGSTFSPIPRPIKPEGPMGIRCIKDIQLSEDYLREELGLELADDVAEVHSQMKWGPRYLLKKGVVYDAPYFSFRMDWNPRELRAGLIDVIGLAAGLAAGLGLALATGDYVHAIYLPVTTTAISEVVRTKYTARKQIALAEKTLEEETQARKMLEEGQDTAEHRARRERIQNRLKGRAVIHDFNNLIMTPAISTDLLNGALDRLSTLINYARPTKGLQNKQLKYLVSRTVDEILEMATPETEELAQKVTRTICSTVEDVTSSDLRLDDMVDAIEQARNEIETLKASHERLFNIIYSIDPTRIKPVPCNLSKALEDIYRECCNGRQIELEIVGETPYGTKFPMHVIERYAQNSFLNSLESEGTTRIEVHYEVIEQTLYMSITDDGEGFDGETGRKIMQEGFSTKKAKGNQGVGTTGIQELVQHFDGAEYRIEGEPGLGARASLRIGVEIDKSIIYNPG
ncbi:ATP-binding protein [Candidatus Woesearchaeota archaeon]|nr:ATP-binding protein [Candidatus Woesearchaeota archaeon]